LLHAGQFAPRVAITLLGHLYKYQAVVVVFLFFLCFLIIAVVLLAADAHHRHRFTSVRSLSPCYSQHRCASIEPLRV
jgi:nitrate/nitrite transporter NarK